MVRNRRLPSTLNRSQSRQGRTGRIPFCSRCLPGAPSARLPATDSKGTRNWIISTLFCQARYYILYLRNGHPLPVVGGRRNHPCASRARHRVALDGLRRGLGVDLVLPLWSMRSPARIVSSPFPSSKTASLINSTVGPRARDQSQLTRAIAIRDDT